MAGIKRSGHKEIIFCSSRNYTVDGYEKVLGEVKFPNYEDFDNQNDTYSNFIQKLMEVIEKITPAKNKKNKKKFSRIV